MKKIRKKEHRKCDDVLRNISDLKSLFLAFNCKESYEIIKELEEEFVRGIFDKGDDSPRRNK